MQPEDMSKWARNERLYSDLMARGLVVHPITSSIRNGGIEFMLVSTDLLDIGRSNAAVALGGIVFPVESLEVA